MLENFVNNQSEADFMDEYSQAVEPVETTDAAPDDMDFGEMGGISTPDERKLVETANSTMVDFLVKIADRTIARMFAMYAYSKDYEEFQADKNELREISEIVNRMTPKERAVMPDWMLLTISLLMVYGVKFDVASRKRKEYEKNHA